jgi:parallel beta-helix repeat protein
MSKRMNFFVALSISLLFLMSVYHFSLPTAEAVEPVERTRGMIIVNASGYGDYTHIQWAVDNASARDTIYVEAGTYYENVVIEKTITLIGEGSENTIIDGGGIGDVIHVDADRVNISGFNITNCGDDFERDMGVELNGSSHSKIENNVIFSNYFSGISLFSSDNNTIANNTCHRNGIAVVLRWNSFDNVITNNTCYWNYERGISVHGPRNRIDNNTCRRNGWAGITVGPTWGNILTDNNCSSSQAGISMAGSYGNEILQNTCHLNNYGIELSGSWDNYISKNHCFRNNNGIALGQVSNDNLITGNHIANNTKWGLGINYYPFFCEDGCGSNLVYHNKFINNNNGNTQAVDNSSGNSWNYTSIGNYWSDIPANDEDGDGIIDQTYTIGGNSGSFDFFPLSAKFDPTKPVAFGGNALMIPTNNQHNFDGSYSYDDTAIANFTWTFYYNGTQVTLYGAKASFLFSTPGNYTITLSVVDSDGNSDSDVFVITVNPIPDKKEPNENPDLREEGVKKDESSVFIWFGILIIALVLTTIGFLVFAVGRKKSKEGMIAGGPGKSKNGITEKEN